MDILFVWTNHFDMPQGLFTYGNKNIYECIEIRYSDLISFDDQVFSRILCNYMLQVFQQTKFVYLFLCTVNVNNELLV